MLYPPVKNNPYTVFKENFLEVFASTPVNFFAHKIFFPQYTPHINAKRLTQLRALEHCSGCCAIQCVIQCAINICMLYTWRLAVLLESDSMFRYPYGKVQWVRVELIHRGFTLLASEHFQVVCAAHQNPKNMTLFLLSTPGVRLLE